MIDQETCPRCGGCGHARTPDAWGHYGDCNADAGEAYKPIIRLCPDCDGVGSIEDKQDARDKAAEAMLALLNVLTGNRANIANRELELTAWCLLSVFWLTEHSQTAIAQMTGYTRANVCKKINKLAQAMGKRVRNGKSDEARKTYSVRQMIVAQSRNPFPKTENLWRINHD